MKILYHKATWTMPNQEVKYGLKVGEEITILEFRNRCEMGPKWRKHCLGCIRTTKSPDTLICIGYGERYGLRFKNGYVNRSWFSDNSDE